MSNPSPTDSGAPPGAPVKSLRVAYVLLLLTGAIGAHRFYLEKWLTGLVYVIVCFTSLIIWELPVLIVLGIALLTDAALLPRMTAQANRHIALKYSRNPDHYHRRDPEVAPWALREKTGFWYALKGPVRVASFVGLPVLYTGLMVEMGNYELIVFPVFILLATGLVTTLDEIIQRHPTLLQLPGVEGALNHMTQMKRYYQEHEPLLRAPLLRVFTRARTEFRPYWKIAGLVMLAILFDFVLSFGYDYGDYLGLEDAWPIVLLQILIIFYAVLILLSQLSALSFHYSLSGKRLRLRFLAAIALALTGFFFAIFVDLRNDPGEVSLLSGERLAQRLQNEAFQEALVDYSSMFITYYGPESTGPDTPADKKRICDDAIARNQCEPTRWLRELLGGLAPNDENQAFHVFDARLVEGESSSDWRGVRYSSPTERIAVAAYSEPILCRGFGFNHEADAGYCAYVLEKFTNLDGEEPLTLNSGDGASQ